jgi:hypothetical protein
MNISTYPDNGRLAHGLIKVVNIITSTSHY